jgi:glycosyltransferase involved in cell wall biosynthesis
MILSIVIPAYNKAKQIGRLLDSLIESKVSKTEIEIIVVNDNSDDDTLRIILNYIQEYSYIHLKNHEYNQGVHEARNSGMDQAKGKWICFIDGDDYLLYDELDFIVRFLLVNSTKSSLVYFPYETSDSHEKTGCVTEGTYSIGQVFGESIFRPVKGCLPLVERRLIQNNMIKWYFTNMDSLFYRECIFKSEDKTLLFIDHVVGIYDRSTENSLSKMRSDFKHIAKYSNKKFYCYLKYYERMSDYFMFNIVDAKSYTEMIYREYRFSDWKMYKLAILFKYLRKYDRISIVKYLLTAVIPKSLLLYMYKKQKS